MVVALKANSQVGYSRLFFHSREWDGCCASTTGCMLQEGFIFSWCLTASGTATGIGNFCHNPAVNVCE